MKRVFPLLLLAVAMFITGLAQHVSAQAQQFYCPTITQNLSVGSADEKTKGQVTELHYFLSSFLQVPFETFANGRYTTVTRDYVKKFQEAHGITPATGLVRELTRAKIRFVCVQNPSAPAQIHVTGINAGNAIASTPNYTYNISAGQPLMELIFKNMNGGVLPSSFELRAELYKGDQLLTEQNVNGIASYYISHPYPYTFIYNYTPGEYRLEFYVNGVKSAGGVFTIVRDVQVAKTSIEIAPRNAQAQWVDSVSIGEPLPIVWSVYNAPAQSQVQLWVKLLHSYEQVSGSSGGDWNSKALPVGNSDGGYQYLTGPGRLEIPGLYEVSAFVIACEPEGCEWNNNSNPTPGSPSRIAYAKAKPFNISVARKGETSKVYVDVKVNGTDGPVVLSTGQEITLSWMTQGVYKCGFGDVGGFSIPVADETQGVVSALYSGGYISMNCLKKTDTNMSVQDSVQVQVANPSTKIEVTSPKGGEQWEIGQLNTITWAPYGYNPDVNPAKDVDVYLVDVSGNRVGRVMDTGKASLHTYFNIDDYQTFAKPGKYYLDVVNRVTGAFAKSEPFTLLPKSVDLQVNGSDNPTQLSQGQTVTLAWKSPVGSACSITGVRDAGSVNNTPATNGQFGFNNLPASSPGFSAVFIGTDYAGSIYLSCTLPSGVVRSDSVGVIPAPSGARVKIMYPNGGEILDETKELVPYFSYYGIKNYSIALYKNDMWIGWLVKSQTPNTEGNMRETISSQNVMNAIGPSGVTPGAVYKLYVTAEKSDGTGYVDDKSDASFSFVDSIPGLESTLAVTSPQEVVVGKEYPISWNVTSGSTLLELAQKYPTAYVDIIARHDDSSLGIGQTIAGRMPITSAVAGSFSWRVRSTSNDGRPMPSGVYTISTAVLVPITNDQSSAVASAVGKPFKLSNTDVVQPGALKTPTIKSFTISPKTVQAGKEVSISWNVGDATRCVLQSSNGAEFADLPVRGTQKVVPFSGFSSESQSIEYTLWCANDPGNGADGPSVSKKTSVTVSSAPALRSCTFGDQTVAPGETITTYQSGEVAAGKRCMSQVRKCNNGTLSGSYAFSTCSVAAYKDCTFGNDRVAHGQTIKAYRVSSAKTAAQCGAQNRKCTNGVLSGTAQFATCAVSSTPATPTATPSGVEAIPGVDYNALSGSAALAVSDSCSVRVINRGVPTTRVLKNGEKIVLYLAQVGVSAKACAQAAQVRTCSSGVLSGNPKNRFATCAVQ